MKLICVLAVASLAAAAPARAQQTSGEASGARFHFGPLSLTPKLAIQNLGVDSNVFNTSTSPLRDVTATLTPGVDAWLRLNRVLLTSKTSTDWVYYQKASSQRAFNVVQDWRIDVETLRATPRLTGQYLRTRQRPNDEVDIRVQQKLVSAGAGITVPAGVRLHFEFDARRTRYDFSQGPHGDPTVAQALNRDSDYLTLVGRVELTPLTSVAVKADSIRDRFVFTPDRDSDSLRVMPGIIFQPFALISGSAFVGIRRFNTLSAAVPDFTGAVAAVELKYVALDMLRVVGQIKRDVDYSLELGEPFYVSTSAGVEVMQMLGLNWDVVARIRRATLAYQAAVPGATGRVDVLRVLGLGLGRRVGDELRIGLDVDYLKRSSALPSRAFEGLRFGGSLTYGY